jgi:hypothetical protein
MAGASQEDADFLVDIVIMSGLRLERDSFVEWRQADPSST